VEPRQCTVAHISIDLGSRRTVKITTLAAIPIEKLVEKLRGPKQIGRK
jgi:uncharacterized protein with GYD domain